MNRFFGRREGSFFVISPDDAHHLLTVLRLQVGEEIEGVEQGKVFRCLLASRDPLLISIIGEKESEAESSLNLTLAFSLLKGGHDELVIQKGTELGVKEFLPFISSRTIIRLDEAGKRKREERFRKIVEGASSQSKRTMAPSVHKIVSFDEALENEASMKLFSYEGEIGKSNTLANCLKDIKANDSLIVFVGPEGGFSEEEVRMALQKGYSLLSLGRRILRAETASLFVASIVSSKGDSL